MKFTIELDPKQVKQLSTLDTDTEKALTIVIDSYFRTVKATAAISRAEQKLWKNRKIGM